MWLKVTNYLVCVHQKCKIKEHLMEMKYGNEILKSMKMKYLKVLDVDKHPKNYLQEIGLLKLISDVIVGVICPLDLYRT